MGSMTPAIFQYSYGYWTIVLSLRLFSTGYKYKGGSDGQLSMNILNHSEPCKLTLTFLIYNIPFGEFDIMARN